MCLEMRGIVKRFGPKVVLKGIDVRVSECSIHVVIGPNGAGKTTLVRVALGVLLPDEGFVRIFGHPPRDKRVKKLVGYLGERIGLLPHHTVRQELTFSCLAKGFDFVKCSEEVRKVVKLFDLGELLDSEIGKLSFGTKQRIALARAFIGEPKLIVLDEPFRGLDATWRKKLVEIIRDFASKGSAVFMTSHVLQELPLDDVEATLIVSGKVVARGLLREVMKLWS